MFAEKLRKKVWTLLREYGFPDLLNQQVLIENLTFLYFTTLATEHLLIAAAKKTGNPDHKVYFLTHLAEERDHSLWLKEDLASVGVDVDRLIPPYFAETICGRVYYNIFHRDPCALFGYMLMAESFPVSLDVINKLEGLHGKSLMRTFRYHAEHDPQHWQDMIPIIDVLSDDQKIIVETTAFRSARDFAEAAMIFRKAA